MSESRSELERRRALFGFDPDWLAKHEEPMLEPDLPIVDPHHHLWDHGSRYLFYEYLTDIDTGHNVRGCVFIQCDAMYRADGDHDFAPDWRDGVRQRRRRDECEWRLWPARVCAGIVGYADLQLGERVDAVLEAHLRAGGGAFSRHPRPLGLGRRSLDQGICRDFPPELLARRKVPRRREPPREVRLELRRVAFSPANPRTRRPCREVS